MGRKRARHRARTLPRIEVIHELQFGICYLCATEVPHPRSSHVSPHKQASLDHVIPKNPPPEYRDFACPHIRRNALVSHHICNTKKANRLPYPCEFIFLDAVNQRLADLKVRTRSY